MVQLVRCCEGVRERPSGFKSIILVFSAASYHKQVSNIFHGVSKFFFNTEGCGTLVGDFVSVGYEYCHFLRKNSLTADLTSTILLNS